MWIVAPPTLAIWSIYAKKVIGCIFAPGQPSNKVGYGHVTGTCIHFGKRMAVLDPHLHNNAQLFTILVSKKVMSTTEFEEREKAEVAIK